MSYYIMCYVIYFNFFYMGQNCFLHWPWMITLSAWRYITTIKVNDLSFIDLFPNDSVYIQYSGRHWFTLTHLVFLTHWWISEASQPRHIWEETCSFVSIRGRFIYKKWSFTCSCSTCSMFKFRNFTSYSKGKIEYYISFKESKGYT